MLYVCFTFTRYLITFTKILVPNPATDINITDGRDKETSLVVHWKKPNGGDEIEVYEVTWSDDTDTFSVNVSHEKGTVLYKHEITGLVSGQSYSILVATYNSEAIAVSAPTVETTGELDDIAPRHVD